MLQNKSNNLGNDNIMNNRNTYNSSTINHSVNPNYNGNGKAISPKTTILSSGGFSNKSLSKNDSREKFNLNSLVKHRLSKSSSNFNLKNRLENSQLNCFQILKGHESAINCLILIKDSNQEYLIVTGGQDRDIKIWHYSTGECIRTLTGHLDSISSLTKIRRNELIISTGDDRLIKIWEYHTGQRNQTLECY